MSITIFEDAEFGGESKEFLDDAEHLEVNAAQLLCSSSTGHYMKSADAAH